MGKIKELSVDFKAETSNFESGVKNAENSLNHLGETAKKAEGGMHGFEAEMLTSRHSVKAFAELSDTPAAPIMSVMHAFEALPGPAGVALGSLVALKMAFDAHEEAAKHAAEENEKFAETMQKVQEMQFEPGKFATNSDAQVKALDAGIKEVLKDIEEHGGGINQFFGLFDMGAAQDKLAALEDMRDKIQKSQKPLEDLSGKIEDLNQKKIDLEIAGDKDPVKIGAVLNDMLEELGHQLEKVPEGTRDWRKIHDEMNKINLEITRMNEHTEMNNINEAIHQMDRSLNEVKDNDFGEWLDRLDGKAATLQKMLDTAESVEAQKKLREELEKTEDTMNKALNDKVAKQFADAAKKMAEAIKKTTEENQTPFEKFAKRVEDLKDQFANGLDAENFTRALKKAKDDFDKTENKELPKVNKFEVINTHNIDVKALGPSGGQVQHKQEIHSEQLTLMIEEQKKATKILQEAILLG